MKRKAVCIVFGFALISQAAAHGEIYKCVDPDTGRAVFSQIPCTHGTDPMDLDVHTPDASVAKSTAQRWREIGQQQERARTLAAAERRLEKLESQRDAELARIAARRRWANNNLAGATLENALAADNQAVIDKYAPLIDAAQRDLERLRYSSP
ncbi:hypothetical protein MARPU_09600 [Marichromatium purpuratum 984]|uniref:DUF4124 domain-containing protein n=1 Tax=Marichromatium purpuratum 984 TaxID=765910 RepID=W0E3S3_MARPU|nr:DUF4124 domain-containing protein [Marichromatium purpuratum]AHF05515.1 hypothetical protein MARPU_09600 [Marichromatium purpuratum 984]